MEGYLSTAAAMPRYELWFAVGRTRGKAHEMMQRFWSVLAVTLGKRAGLVSVIGLLVTLVLGFGITKLDFATGQDSYLNKGDQVYKDNVAYQDLFGGQAMLTVITMDDGHTVDELFTAENREQLQQFHDELLDAGTLHGVITPLTIAEFADSLVQSDNGDPTASIAGGALQTALTKEAAGSPEQEARLEDAGTTLERINAVPVEQRTFDNPEWVNFLLYDNEGDIRLAHRSFILDPTHAQIVTRLTGNESIETEGKAADLVRRAGRQARPVERERHHHRRAGVAEGHQRLPAAAGCSRSAGSPWRS